MKIGCVILRTLFRPAVVEENPTWQSNSEGAMEQRVIVIDREILNGTPCFRGTRVPFQNLLDYLEAGHPLDEFLRPFPTVTRPMAVQALEEAKESRLAHLAWGSC